MVSAENLRRAIDRLWPGERHYILVQPEEEMRFTVPGLTRQGRAVQPFKRRFRRWLANLLVKILASLATPAWLSLLMLLSYRPNMVWAKHPHDQAVSLARALVPARIEGISRRPRLIINPHRLCVFDYILGEAVVRWTGAPISVSVRRLLQGFSVRLEFLDGSTMAMPVTETEARLMDIVLAPNG